MKPGFANFLPAWALFGAALVCAPCTYADDSKFSLSTGFDYSYGQYSTGPWAFKLIVPSDSISGTGALIPRSGGHAIGSTQPALNETEAAAIYSLYSDHESSTGIDVTGKVKLNIDDKYLGLTSFQNDYAAQADAYQGFDRFKALGSLGYKIHANPVGLDTNRVLYGSVGGTYQINDQIRSGVDFSLSQAPTTLNQGQRQISAYVSQDINRRFKAKGYLLRDYSDGNADSKVGAAVSYGF